MIFVVFRQNPQEYLRIFLIISGNLKTFFYTQKLIYLLIKLMFQLKASYLPAGDQPKAIDQISRAFDEGKHHLTLLGATGTGKTFTMANIIQKVQKPTLVISHNKTLAAQLATEFKSFFPDNAVHYFVSYFDYYQPESYLPSSGTYIEKEATINQEIEMYRLATMASLLSRPDVIVVASASSLYGLGQSRFFEENCLQLYVNHKYSFDAIKKQLLHMQYKPIQGKIEAGMFEIKGDILDIFSSTEKCLYRCFFDEETLERIEKRDSLSYELLEPVQKTMLWPATQYLQDVSDLEKILQQMDAEKELRVKEFEKMGMALEAERIKKKVEYDIRMIRETGFVNGIENYSLYFDQRLPGEPPNTIFDYFPDDFLMIVDESHMTIPQLRAMAEGDRARKNNLIRYGFRLPSAIDHRPLRFEELEVSLGRKSLDTVKLDQATQDLELVSTAHQQVLDTSSIIKSEARKANHYSSLKQKIKSGSKAIFLSATPAEYELELSEQVVEQIIRPTGLLDPITYVYPKSGDYAMLIDSLDPLLKKKPHLDTYLETPPTEEQNSSELQHLFEDMASVE
ncbi:excinuclease ABC subunit B [Candidatus Gracilibacteria bacterium]|nr:MAG: excinuclease ABC subunit B [Candidatus Gracilibacteria bacterium]